MIRTLIERVSRNRVLKRRLPPEFGRRPLFVSPDSALSYLKRDMAGVSRELLEAAGRFVKPGQTVWDIGGNVGVFTLSAAHAAGKGGVVVAMEPDPFLADLIQRTKNHEDNQDLDIRVMCAAVSDKPGVSRFVIAQRGRSSNSLESASNRATSGGVRSVQYVPTTTLDTLLEDFPTPDVIKIDVEGAEVMVMQGAPRILSEVRPVFYIEVGKEQADAVTAIFKENDYRLYNGDNEDETVLTSCMFNTFAVPSESSMTNRGTKG